MATPPDKDAGPHIMISYNWGSKDRAMKLRDKLKEADYNVWIDDEQMEGSLISCMADAVENAAAVLMCVSTKYQNSENCKSEAENAYLLKKRIIPLIFETEFAENMAGWLGFIVRPRLYFRFDTDELMERNFPDVLGALGDAGRKITAKSSTVKVGRLKALQCSICSNRFKTPKSLPCLHTFCSACVVRIAPMGTQTVSCPTCNQKASVPDGDATKFPTNFILRELIEEEAKRERLFQKDEGFMCTCCDKKSPVDGKCEDCNQYVCADGVDVHKRFAALRGHKVLLYDTEDIEPMSKPAAAPTPAASKPKSAPKTSTDWAIFDALFDEEHSIHLFGYWMKEKGEGSWQDSMVGHYSSCLTALHEGGLTADEVIPRYMNVTRVFMQVGQYSKALELVDTMLGDNDKFGTKEPETLANLYYLGGEIYREMLNAITDSKDKKDLPKINQLIEYARKALETRREMAANGNVNQDDNKFAIGRILRILASGLGRIWIAAGEDDSTGEGEKARSEARKSINESVEIFTQLGAEGNAARSIMTQANLEDPGSEEREKLFRQAIQMTLEVYGESSTLSSSLYRAMSVLYEHRGDYYEAYDWLVKSRNIRQKLYGKDHPRTIKVYKQLQSDVYAKINEEKESALRKN